MIPSFFATAESGYKQFHFEASSSDKFIDCLLMRRPRVGDFRSDDHATILRLVS